MERYFNATQPEMGLKAKRILELNVEHPAFAALEPRNLYYSSQNRRSVFKPGFPAPAILCAGRAEGAGRQLQRLQSKSV